VKCILVGTVDSGRGRARQHLSEHAQVLARYLGAPPVPGSLNLVLRQPVGFDFQQCRVVCNGRFFWAASVAGVPALAYRWKGCPLHIVEMVAAVRLRSQLAADDGDEVSIIVEGTRSLTLKQYISWWILWGLRRDSYYKSNRPVTRFKWLKKYASQKSMRHS
jgi:riboflavin kinase, archaea type